MDQAIAYRNRKTSTREWTRLKLSGLQWVVTGLVPYNPGDRTLADMMREFVLSSGVDEQNVTIGEGVGIASEARNVMEEIAGSNAEVHLVSSNWYLWPGKLIWKRHAKRQGVQVHFVPVYGTGGWRTRLLYFCYFLVVLAAKFVGQLDWLEDRLTKSQEKRKIEGFQRNGCV